jgi:uncharacterized membrane protein SpoIIM required for sporulation
MATPELRSSTFRRDREAAWHRLETLLRKAEHAGIGSFTGEERLAFPQLYRAALSSLSVARAVVLDRTLIAYLDALCTRAYFVLYAPKRGFWTVFSGYFLRDLPRAVRAARGSILLAGLVLFAGAMVGWSLVAADPEIFRQLIPDSLAQGRGPYASTEELRRTLYGNIPTSEQLRRFALFLFQNNSLVMLLSFALGIALGIPTIILAFYNGTILGAFVALFSGRGLGYDVAAWLMIHGTTEILALILGAGAGLSLAGGILFPKPRQSRLASAAERGKRAGLVALGAIMLLFAAAILEGFGRQLIQDPALRMGIGVGMAALWTMYFCFAGRQGESDG